MKSNFEKDNEDACKFVFAATNLRCFTYSIPFQSELETTKVAGNIVPAISTTNAMVAALQINQLIKIILTSPGALFRQYKKVDRAEFNTVYLTNEIYTKSMNSEMLNHKNLKCVSCGTNKVEIMFAP